MVIIAITIIAMFMYYNHYRWLGYNKTRFIKMVIMVYCAYDIVYTILVTVHLFLDQWNYQSEVEGNWISPWFSTSPNTAFILLHTNILVCGRILLPLNLVHKMWHTYVWWYNCTGPSNTWYRPIGTIIAIIHHAHTHTHHAMTISVHIDSTKQQTLSAEQAYKRIYWASIYYCA